MLLPAPGEPKLSLPWSKRLWGNLLVAGGSPVPCKGDSHSTFLPTLPGGPQLLLWARSDGCDAAVVFLSGCPCLNEGFHHPNECILQAPKSSSWYAGL